MIMGVKIVIIKSVFCMTLVLLACSPGGVYGMQVCSSTSLFEPTKVCDDNEYCCGPTNNDCCGYLTPNGSVKVWTSGNPAMELFAMLVMLMMITCCCVCCYRCCCGRTSNRGFVYTTPGATSVSVSLPPNQSQQVPYPTVVPYPQQTPYPPQYNPPTNPYYGMPPPAYGVAVQSGNQQSSAPSAPYIQS